MRHVSVEQALRDEGDSLHMDVDVQVQHGAPYDLGLELDLVRNNVRYGPRIHLDIATLNARSRGGRRAVESWIRLRGGTSHSQASLVTLGSTARSGRCIGMPNVWVWPLAVESLPGGIGAKHSV